MSKPTTRIVLISLLAIVLVAATYFTVQAAFAKAASVGAQSHSVSGLQTNFNHDRSTAAELKALQAPQNYFEPEDGRYGGGCDHESQTVPLD